MYPKWIEIIHLSSIYKAYSPSPRPSPGSQTFPCRACETRSSQAITSRFKSQIMGEWWVYTTKNMVQWFLQQGAVMGIFFLHSEDFSGFLELLEPQKWLLDSSDRTGIFSSKQVLCWGFSCRFSNMLNTCILSCPIIVSIISSIFGPTSLEQPTLKIGLGVKRT